MKWNAFELISPAINKTKERVLPFNFWQWLRLGFISSLGGRAGGFSLNFNSGGGSGSSSGGQNSLPGTAYWDNLKDQVTSAFKSYWFVGAIIISLLLLVGFLLNYVLCVFNFILLDSVLTKKAIFTFRKNSSKGISLFWFKLCISLITLLGVIILAAPLVYFLATGKDFFSAGVIIYLILAILAFIIFIIAIWFLTLFVVDFVTAFMYSKNLPAYFSWKTIWSFVKKNKKETFVYWAARLLMGIVTAIIGVCIYLGVFFLLIILFGVIALILWIFYKILGMGLLFLVLGIIVLVVLIVVFIIACMMLTMPLVIFLKYFHLLNFEKLTGIKLFK